MSRAVAGEPVNVMRRTPGFGHQRGTDLFADALHEVVGARREPRFEGQLGEQRSGERRPLGRFVDHAVAGGQRRRELPGG